MDVDREAATHLLIISARKPLAWVLENQRMAFPSGRRRRAAGPAQGDEVLLYTTRGCFGNPTRDLGRVMGLATVTSEVRPLDEPVLFGERRFAEGCTLHIDGLAPLRKGVILRDLVDRLKVFPKPDHWSVYLRRASLRLPGSDAALVKRELRPLLKPYGAVVAQYAVPA
ncbi:hypothetical protein [Streptomyces aidingensis]|uniref:EVE domain-containing protein n=1 Tax=Streptomyces aidingensis TaxID=910347 RepID=A0A1I1UQH8_9ACTN|nr:hypothetical protein [Streptomyces aidingensis]SFD72855.1 hypothetical protein SAMN05421773_1269 [Streptomyces aidingensis]